MASIKIPMFGGEAPKVAATKIAETQAQTAKNCNLLNGNLRAWRSNLPVHRPSKSGTKKSIYRWNSTADGDAKGDITGATQANPVEITSNSHGLSSGDRVHITGVGGMTALNNRTFTITVTSSNTFTLDGEDGTGYNAYTSGGVWVKENGFWFHWTSDVDVARGPIDGDTEERTYYTGDGDPKMTYAGISTSGGGTDYPTNSYLLGLPAPATAPTAAISGTADDPDDVPETRVYVYTYVSAKGEEGPPTSASNSVDWRPGQTVDLTGMDTAPTGNYNVTKKRIYRLVTSESGSDYRYVAEINVSTTSYNDAVASDDLGEVLPSTNWDAPPSDAAGLVAGPNGMMAAFAKNEVLFCEPYFPHAWPSSYRLTTNEDVVALAWISDSLIASTRRTAYRFSGVHPDSMTQIDLETPYPCVSKRSMVDMGDAIFYAASDGLVAVTEGTPPQLLTYNLLEPADFQDLSPTTILGARLDHRYVGFYDNGTTQAGFVFDPREQHGTWYTLDFHATAAYTDPETGQLYLQVGDDIVRFDGADDLLTYNWKSKLFVAARPVNLVAGWVDAESYPVTLKVYADQTLRHTESVVDSRPFRMVDGDRAKHWEIELTGSNEVRSVTLAETITELSRP